MKKILHTSEIIAPGIDTGLEIKCVKRDAEMVGKQFCTGTFIQQKMTHQALLLYENTLQVCSNEGIELAEATKALAAQLQVDRQQVWRATDSSLPLIPQVRLPEKTSTSRRKRIQKH